MVWTLLDTGLRVSELAGLAKANLDWEGHRLTVYCKGGSYGWVKPGKIPEILGPTHDRHEGHDRFRGRQAR